MTLQGEVDALIQSLQIRENKINKKRSTRNDRVHWITRGRQQALRQVSTRLLAIEAASVTSYALYLALREYLACLEKCCMDVQEERSCCKTEKGAANRAMEGRRGGARVAKNCACPLPHGASSYA